MAKKKKNLPALDDADRTWRSLVGGPKRLTSAYEAAMRARGFDEEHNLYRLAEMFEEAARFEDLLALSRAAIDEGYDLDEWYPNLVVALVRLGRLDEAEAEMPKLVGNMGYDDPAGLLAAITYHRARGEREIATMLFHAGWKWVPYFKGMSRGVKPDSSLKPADLGPRFLAWLDRWTGAMTGDVTMIANLEELGGWLDTLGAKLTGDRLEEILVEDKRREAAVAEFAKAKDEKSAQAVFDRIAWFVTPIMLRFKFEQVREHAPRTTYALFKQARANQHLSKFANLGEEAVMLELALSKPSLFKELPAAYETAIRTGTARHDQHVDRARAALRLGLRDAALAHLADAMHSLGRYYGDSIIKFNRDAKEIRDRADFKKLHGDAAFETIFEGKTKTATPKSRRRA